MSFWKDFQEYIYTTTPGEIIRRVELVKMFPEYASGRQGSTLDTYRRMMTVMGVLDDTSQPGVYRRGYITLPPTYTKSYTAEKIKELYVYVPDCLFVHEHNKDWSYWERMIWQEFKPHTLLEEFYRGSRLEHDPNSLGFRYYRVKCWNAVARTLGPCTEIVHRVKSKQGDFWNLSEADSAFNQAVLRTFK